MRRPAVLLLALASSACAHDWSHWRGPRHMGISYEKMLPESWALEGEKNVLWTSPIGGRAAPIIQGGRVYLNCKTDHDINDPQQKIHAREQVVCWDLETGKKLWDDQFNVYQTDIPNQRVGWASMCGDSETGYVYMHSVCGVFRCYDKDGKVVWEYSLFEEYGKISGYGGRTQTPIIDEDRVIVSFLAVNWGETKGPAPKHYYYAFDKKTGKLLWVSAPGGRPRDTNYSCPVVTVINGQRMLIAGNADGGVHAMNARTGQPIWGFRMSRRGLNASPVVDGNLVYITHGEDNIDNTKFGRIQCIDATDTGDVTESRSVWRVDGIKAGYASPLVKDGILYVVADTGQLHAFDSKTGKRLWEHNLGTVGKGSPVWGDGKLYVMEVNGNIHILQPTREGCKSLSHVELKGNGGIGLDEVFGSPAISNGRVVFVTRDRTICIGAKGDGKRPADEIPPLAREAEPGTEIATLHLVPYEARVWAGESVQYEVRGYDKNGRFVKKIDARLEPQADLPGAKVEGNKLTTAAGGKDLGGHVVVKHNGLTATARLRVFPKLPWKYTFDDFKGPQVPPAWVRAFIKLKPAKIGDEQAMVNMGGKGRPSTYVWLGPPDMKGYTVQADFLAKEQRRRMPKLGVTAQRYNLILNGNAQKLQIISWAPHERMAKTIKFRWNPDKWYTMKFRVDIEADGAHCRGKVWERGKKEPADWTIETVDPHPNPSGSPGLYFYALAPSYVDNLSVTSGK